MFGTRSSVFWNATITRNCCRLVGSFWSTSILLDIGGLDCGAVGADGDCDFQSVGVGVVLAELAHREVVNYACSVEVGDSLASRWDGKAGGEFGVVVLGDARGRVGERVVHLERSELGGTGIAERDFQVVASGFACGIDVVLDNDGVDRQGLNCGFVGDWVVCDWEHRFVVAGGLDNCGVAGSTACGDRS